MNYTQLLPSLPPDPGLSCPCPCSTLRRQQATSPLSTPNPRSLLLKPGAIKRLLRKAKLPHEFAVHRCGLPPPLPPSSPVLQPATGAHSPTRAGLHTVAFSEEVGPS